MNESWWAQVLFGFFAGIGFAVGTALINGVIRMIAGEKR